MFLSRFLLDTSRREVGRWLVAPNTVHAALMSAVQPAEDERLLWRIDRFSDAVELYTVAPREYDPAELVKVATDGGSGSWRCQEMSTLLNGLQPGQRWRFRLTASPTMAIARKAADGTRRRGKVIPLVTREQQQQWLLDRSGAAGFAIDAGAFSLIEQRRWEFRRNTGSANGPGSRVTLHTATFEGLLTVTDADSLRRALGDGLGRGKAYGCGLLTLAQP